MSDHVTYSFKCIFNSYDNWKIFAREILSTSFDEVFDNFCYRCILSKFANNNIRYSSLEDFKNALGIVYLDKFEKYKKEKEIIDSIYQLTLDDLKVINESISNNAENPNNVVEDPTKPLTYISEQAFAQVRNGKIQSYLQALNNIPSLNVQEFLTGYTNKNNKLEMTFKDLFMQSMPTRQYIYPIEEE